MTEKAHDPKVVPLRDNMGSSAIYLDKNTVMPTAPIDVITAFLRDEVGITVLEEALPDDTFLPGVEICGFAIVFDRAKLKNCGDLLHEAGHLALLAEAVRVEHRDNGLPIPTALMDDVELGALAWSYAATVDLRLPPEIVFHGDGYHGRSEGLLMGFSVGIYPGLMQLENARMALCAQSAMANQLPAFPAMLRWLRA